MSPVAGLPQALALLLIIPFDVSLFDQSSCLTPHFYGNYKDGHSIMSLFIPDSPCFDSWASESSATSASIAFLSPGVQQLVWLEEESIDEGLKTQTRWSFSNDSIFDDFLEILSAQEQLPEGDGQGQNVLMLPKTEPRYEVVYRTQTAALLSISHKMAMIIDTIVPRFWKSTLMPTFPVSFLPVPPDAVKRVEHILSTLTFDPVISSIVNNISILQMTNDIRFLTGEDGKSGIVSRHSFAPGARTAAAWLSDRFEDTGATCELITFLEGFAPNVICRYPSTVNTTATVMLSAHYDSRGSFGSARAPGANDDGSGTTALLAIARTIARKRVKFHANVEIVAFAGEEQGLLGSRAYSSELRAADANLTLMIQADMLAYRAPDEPPQLGLPQFIGEPTVGHLVGNISAIYSPELKVGLTAVCCSDHRSFLQQGFPATQVFERVGYIVDPMYHNSGDLSDREGYDLEQARSIAKVQFATLLHAAGFELST